MLSHWFGEQQRDSWLSEMPVSASHFSRPPAAWIAFFVAAARICSSVDRASGRAISAPSGQGGKWVPFPGDRRRATRHNRSEEHTSELQSLMRISYAVFCLKKKKRKT